MILPAVVVDVVWTQGGLERILVVITLRSDREIQAMGIIVNVRGNGEIFEEMSDPPKPVVGLAFRVHRSKPIEGEREVIPVELGEPI
jgi:hypothetical protein